MAHQQDSSAGRQRLVALAAVGGLAFATALAFGRVFTGRAPTWELVAAALASVLIAGACERRGLSVALLASAAGLAVAITWIVLPQTAWYGLPSVRTLRAVGRSLELVTQQTREQVAPTPALAPLMLASVAAVWTAALSTHALAIRAGSPLLAVLPSVALVGFADTVLEDGARPIYAITFLLAALAVVFVDGLRRIRQWGPIWSAIRGRRPHISSRGARQVGLLAVLIAVLVPGLLPGFRSQALVDFSTDDDGVGLDPFVSIQAELDRGTPVDLFQVTSSAGGAYWRLYSLDQFDGTTWSSSDPMAQDGVEFGSEATFPHTLNLSTADPLVQRYRMLRDLDDAWLPMAFPAQSISLPEGGLRFNPDLGTAVFSDGDLPEGFEYVVTSRVVAPGPADLDDVRFQPPSEYGRYTAVPETVDRRVGQIARQLAGDEPTPYRQVLAIQEWLRSTLFSYTTDVEPVADADALLDFLERTHRGFCQQFATAMAVLVRELGYPARVSVGFRAGSIEGDTFTVTSLDAHAWVEVFFPGFGWLPFEPTPTRSNPAAQPGTYLDPAAAASEAPPSVQNPGEPTGVPDLGAGGATCFNASGRPIAPQLCSDPTAQTGLDRPVQGPLPPGLVPTGEPRAAPPDINGYSIPYRWIFAGLAAAVAVLLVAAPIVKWVWRRRMLRRSQEPRELVLAAYRVFDGRATDLGMGRRDGETVAEHQARLTAARAMSDGHLSRLAAVAIRAAYAAEAPSTSEAAEALGDARTAISDLRKDAGLLRRILGTYRPGI